MIFHSCLETMKQRNKETKKKARWRFTTASGTTNMINRNENKDKLLSKMKHIIEGILNHLAVVRPVVAFHVVDGYHDFHPEVS